jgi:hypothetical protein
MVSVYSSFEQFKDLDGISIVDDYFDSRVTSTAIFSESDLKVLKDIEEAEPISNTTLNGRFGNFPLSGLSGGVKAVLLLSLMAQGKLPKAPYIDVTDCGDNVLPFVFELAEKLNIPCILLHFDLYDVPDRAYRVDGETVVHTTDELMDLLAERI